MQGNLVDNFVDMPTELVIKLRQMRENTQKHRPNESTKTQ